MTPHKGNSCPCHPEATVTVQWANGLRSGKQHRAGSLVWKRRNLPFDIACYEVVSVPDEVRS